MVINPDKKMKKPDIPLPKRDYPYGFLIIVGLVILLPLTFCLIMPMTHHLEYKTIQLKTYSYEQRAIVDTTGHPQLYEFNLHPVLNTTDTYNVTLKYTYENVLYKEVPVEISKFEKI